jgi:4a-hydroxytetrahydrobiopterin dehydratase
VDVVLTTHDVGGVSNLDVAMAQFMDKTAGAAGR